MNKFVIILNLTNYEDEDELLTDYQETHTISTDNSLEEFKLSISKMWKENKKAFLLGNLIIDKKGLNNNFDHIQIFPLDDWFINNEIKHNEL